jgi:hypothetical protein
VRSKKNKSKRESRSERPKVSFDPESLKEGNTGGGGRLRFMLSSYTPAFYFLAPPVLNKTRPARATVYPNT